MNVLHIHSHMAFCGSNTELAALAGDQQHRGHRARVCCLGSRGPWTQRLETTGLEVVLLDWKRWFDVKPLWQLREMLGAAEIEVVQLWGPAALRWVGILKPSLLPRAIYSPPLPHPRQTFDRWLLGRVGRIVVRDAAEKNQAMALGARPDSLTVVPPGVAASAVRPSAAKEASRIAGVGPIEKTKNFRNAVWTMDILGEIFPQLELELVGQGSHREELIEFSARFENAALRWTDHCDDVPAHLAGADLCWLPALGGCRHAALETMAAGVPLVASDLPHLREMIPDGDAGFLVPACDKIALARKTRSLVLDAGLRRRMGEAGRRHVLGRYPQDAFLERWRDVVRAA